MKDRMNRRNFLKKSTALAGGLAACSSITALQAGKEPGNKMIVATMGLGRGLDHLSSLVLIPDVEIAYVCDVDDERIARAMKAVSAKQSRPPQAVKDFRRILDDPNVNAITIAAPNHWHAPATILACAAGKHVYVEKPGSQNPREGEWMVEAAQKHHRTVQMGNQRRSWPSFIEGIEKLKSGAIGKVRFARCWYDNSRPSIGKGKPVAVPDRLDYSIWQGPAPEKPYKDNLVHYNWHWHWHWGNGELGNNGIHALDIARWGLGVDCPRRVTCAGGRYHYQDDQETPDTCIATFDFGDKGASWEGSSCHPRKEENHSFVHFYGDQGSLAFIGNGYKIYDMKGKETHKSSGEGGDKIHLANFLECIRAGKKPNSDIAECQKSTLLCHLGNIAYRVGRAINVDPQSRRILDDKEAAAMWGREYRKGWEPKV